jgi:hypothetical protein
MPAELLDRHQELLHARALEAARRSQFIPTIWSDGVVEAAQFEARARQAERLTRPLQSPRHWEFAKGTRDRSGNYVWNGNGWIIANDDRGVWMEGC